MVLQIYSYVRVGIQQEAPATEIAANATRRTQTHLISFISLGVAAAFSTDVGIKSLQQSRYKFLDQS